MRKLTSGDLGRLEAVSESSFNDKCKITANSATTTSRGDYIPAGTVGNEISCGFQTTNISQKKFDDNNYVTYDAILRLPKNTSISSKDLVEITKVLDKAVSLKFTIDGTPEMGKTCLIVKLKKSGG